MLKDFTSSQLVKFRSIHPMEWACLLPIMYILFVRIIGIFSYDTDIEGVEFCSVHFTQLLILNHHLYFDPSQFPYLLIVYTPLYYYVMGGIIHLLPIDVLKDMHNMYVVGRSISILLLFANFFIIIKTIELVIGRFRYKIYLLLFLLITIPIHYYTYRPDSFKVTSFILFLYFSIRFLKSRSYLHYALSFLFILAGILFKQDLVLYGFLLYAVFLFTDKKIIHLFSGVFLAGTLVLLLYGNYLWTGINLFRDLFVYNIQYDSDFHINIIIIIIFLVRIFPMLFFAYFNLFSKDRMTYTLAVLCIVYVLASLLSLLRMGSNFNYTYEAMLLLLINGAIYFKDRSILQIAYPFHIYILFLIFTITKFYPFGFDPAQEKIYKINYLDNLRLSGQLKSIVKNEVLFLPNMRFYIFFPDSRLIYGYDWHYDRYCELNLPIRLKPRFAVNNVVKEYDENFKNGTVQYIIVEDEPKSIHQLEQYYPKFKLYKQVENFLIYKFDNNR